MKDAVAFAASTLVLLLRHKTTQVEFDVSFAWSSFEHEALAAATLEAFGRVDVPVARSEDLIIYKLIAGRPKDHDDIAALTAIDPTVSIERIHRRARELEELIDEGREVQMPPPAKRRNSVAAPKSKSKKKR
jgi:hypothetical protein